jgi:hypothetical protein
MTQEEIIKMARQAGMMTRVLYLGRNLELLTNFAKLVAEHERDACIAHAMTSAEKAIDVAIKLEREACAKMCDSYYESWINIHGRYEFMGEGAQECAEAIRARGQE